MSLFYESKARGRCCTIRCGRRCPGANGGNNGTNNQGGIAVSSQNSSPRR